MIISTIRILNQIIQGYISPPKINIHNKTININFRCWPIDIDSFLHMNNSKYLHTAELSRWRTVGPILPRFWTKGVVFLIAENRIQYLKPIKPFEKYVISSSVSVDEKDDKWIYYTHIFEEHPDDLQTRIVQKENDRGQMKEVDKKIFAKIQMKSVVKETNGKTIKPSELMDQSKYFRDWVTITRQREGENNEQE